MTPWHKPRVYVATRPNYRTASFYIKLSASVAIKIMHTQIISMPTKRIQYRQRNYFSLDFKKLSVEMVLMAKMKRKPPLLYRQTKNTLSKFAIYLSVSSGAAYTA